MAVDHLQTILRTERNTLTTMETDIDIAPTVLVNGVNGTGIDTFAALDAQLFFHDYPAAGPLGKSAGGAYFGAGWRIAGQTSVGDKTGGEPTRGMNADTRSIPGYPMVDKAGTGQGAGLTTDALVHARGSKLFHIFF